MDIVNRERIIKIYYKISLKEGSLESLYNDDNVEFLNSYRLITLPPSTVKINDIETRCLGNIYRVIIYATVKLPLLLIFPICRLKILKNNKNVVKHQYYLFR